MKMSTRELMSPKIVYNLKIVSTLHVYMHILIIHFLLDTVISYLILEAKIN